MCETRICTAACAEVDGLRSHGGLALFANPNIMLTADVKPNSLVVVRIVADNKGAVVCRAATVSHKPQWPTSIQVSRGEGSDQSERRYFASVWPSSLLERGQVALHPRPEHFAVGSTVSVWRLP